MIVTLKESKARLSELVELASRGEDVLITVRGKVRARLVGVPVAAPDVRQWARELEELANRYTVGCSLPSERIFEELREEREL